MKANVHLMMFAAVVSSAVMADTFTWVGNGADNYWGTDANWSKSSGDSERTKPDNADFAVFSQSEDLTVFLYQDANVQGVRLEQGAGSVTLTLGDGWYNGRQLLVRRTTASGTWTPGITNFVNLSSNPFTIKSGLNASLNILFSNAWGDFAMMPGVVFDCPVTSAMDSRGWLLPQAALRTDNAEMNRTVFKRTATFYNTLHVGENHELWVSGENAALSVDYGKYHDNNLDQDIVIEESVIDLRGLLVVDGSGASVTCSNLNVAATGSIGGSGTIYGAVSATTGAKLLFDAENVLTFTADADLSGFTVDATGLDAEQEYLVAKGTTSLPGVSAAQAAFGWMTKANEDGVYLVNSMKVVGEDITLDDDTDWTDEVVAVVDNVTIDLNGHDLYIAGITLGEGVAFVNGGANARVYIGINGADKTWVTNMTLSASIMPVFVGAAIDLPADYIPAGGIGFKDTSGQQPLYNTTCNNGLAFLGGANIIEPWKNWNFGSGKTCTVTVEGENNVFTFNNDNGGTNPSAFTTTPFVGSGKLTIVSSSTSSVAPIVGDKSTDKSGFSGTISLLPANNYVGADGYGIRLEDDNNKSTAFCNGTVALCRNADTDAVFSLRSGNWSTPPTYNLGNVVTGGDHPERVVLSSLMNSAGMTATLKVGWNNEDGVFAGTITNVNREATNPINIEKHGTGTWTLAGTVANGGTFKVESGCVEFRNGLANVTGLAVASGASALFAGDMGSNPISFAPGATLKLDASSAGDDVPVVHGDLDLTGVAVSVSQGSYVPSKTVPRELLRVTGVVSGLDRRDVVSDIDSPGWSFRVLSNGDGTKSLWHSRNTGFSVILR